jgi:hypothetical protein
MDYEALIPRSLLGNGRIGDRDRIFEEMVRMIGNAMKLTAVTTRLRQFIGEE